MNPFTALKNFSTFHFTSLHFHYTSLHFTSFHFTSFHFTSLYFTSIHFTSIQFNSIHFTSLYFTSIHFNSNHFTTLHFISLHYTLLQCTSLQFNLLHYISLHFTSFHFTSLHYSSLFSLILSTLRPITGHKAQGKHRFRSTRSLTSVLYGVGSQRHAPAALPPGKTRYSLLGWPQVGLDGCGKSVPHQDSIPGPPSPWPVAIPTELSRLTVTVKSFRLIRKTYL